jgi:hypothetical protein
MDLEKRIDSSQQKIAKKTLENVRELGEIFLKQAYLVKDSKKTNKYCHLAFVCIEKNILFGVKEKLCEENYEELEKEVDNYLYSGYGLAYRFAQIENIQKKREF